LCCRRFTFNCASECASAALTIAASASSSFSASLASARANALLSTGADPLVALNGGYHIAFLIGAVFAAVAALLGALLLRAGRQIPGQRGSEADAGMQAAAE